MESDEFDDVCYEISWIWKSVFYRWKSVILRQKAVFFLIFEWFWRKPYVFWLQECTLALDMVVLLATRLHKFRQGCWWAVRTAPNQREEKALYSVVCHCHWAFHSTSWVSQMKLYPRKDQQGFVLWWYVGFSNLWITKPDQYMWAIGFNFFLKDGRGSPGKPTP